MGDTHAAARAASSLGLDALELNRSDEALATLRPAFDALSGDEHDVDVGRLAAELARIEHFAGEQSARATTSSSRWTWPRRTATWRSSRSP